MRVLFINSVFGIRSTGRIVAALAEQYMAEGHECRIAYGRETIPDNCEGIAYRIGNKVSIYTNALQSRIFDNDAFTARKATKAFIKWASEYNPDLLWLHNLHGYYINVEMLFDWIKSRPHMQVKWTLHDCWAFTGHCTHFSYVQCERWKSRCHHCPQKKEYPKSVFLDQSKANFERKKKKFCDVKNMTLIASSNWLAERISQSFLQEYPITVTYPSFNFEKFQPTKGNFRATYHIENKKMILGVATSWSERKGLYDFVALSKILDDTYTIVLVGLTPKQMSKMPKNIICLSRTNSIEELAEIYTAADLFVNPSYEETFGLTTVEALSCGTNAVVYKGTACEEVVKKYGGIAVEQNIQALYEAILYLTQGDCCLPEKNENINHCKKR